MLFLYTFINDQDMFEYGRKLYVMCLKLKHYLRKMLFIYTGSRYGVRLKSIIYRQIYKKRYSHLFDKNHLKLDTQVCNHRSD